MNRLQSLFTPFQRLQWKLTLSYTLVSTGALLVVELLLFAGILLFLGSNILSGLFIQTLEEEIAPQVRPFLAQTPPDVDGLQAWSQNLLSIQTQLTPGQEPRSVNSINLGSLRISDADQQLAILAPDLSVLVIISDSVAAQTEPFNAGASAETAAALAVAQDGTAVTHELPGGARLLAVPVLDDNQTVVGLITLTYRLPLLDRQVLTPILQAIGLTLIPFTIATGLVGALFGFLTARGLTRRIHQMSSAADAWSRGEFNTDARDNSGDELGELSRRLHHMAEQLQNLLHTRQELAAVEERNRLARELHDSVKQQFFAAKMQLAAARAVLDSDPVAAGEHLAEAELLAAQAQQELTGLILELRPAALEGRGLAEALRDYAADWSRRTNVAVEVRVQGERPLSLDVEQALFRVAQEALANVARHSQAKTADLHLAWQDKTVTLTIHDDGRGFDSDKAAGGVGLQSMSERMTHVGGRLHLQSRPGGGTTIVAQVSTKSERPNPLLQGLHYE